MKYILLNFSNLTDCARFWMLIGLFGMVLFSPNVIPAFADDPAHLEELIEWQIRTPHGTFPVEDSTSITYIEPNVDVLMRFTSTRAGVHFPLTVQAHLKDWKQWKLPVAVPGYSEIRDEIVKGDTENHRVVRQVVQTIRRSDALIDTEIALSAEKVRFGDQLIVTLQNTQNQTRYTKVFEVARFGWDTRPSSSVIWVKSYDSSVVNFQTAPSFSFLIRYKQRPDATFWKRFLVPGFGPQVTMVDVEQSKTVGLGGFMSTLGNALQIGGGMFLNRSGGLEDRLYYFIGVNFVEGLDAIAQPRPETADNGY